jgi:hypothetical protein
VPGYCDACGWALTLGANNKPTTTRIRPSADVAFVVTMAKIARDHGSAQGYQRGLLDRYDRLTHAGTVELAAEIVSLTGRDGPDVDAVAEQIEALRADGGAS